MADGLPAKAKVGVPGKSVDIDPSVYFTAVRMERAGTLKRGQALMLAATLTNATKATVRGAKRSKRK